MPERAAEPLFATCATCGAPVPVSIIVPGVRVYCRGRCRLIGLRAERHSSDEPLFTPEEPQWVT